MRMRMQIGLRLCINMSTCGPLYSCHYVAVFAALQPDGMFLASVCVRVCVGKVFLLMVLMLRVAFVAVSGPAFDSLACSCWPS